MLEFIDINCEFSFSRRNVERVGPAFLNLQKYNANPEEATQNDEDDDANDKLPEEFAVDVEYLKSLDPKEWKDHDHYAILGLGKLRFNATDDDIRRAYRRMVLMHHPDKRKAKGEDVNADDDYFTCITKAYEILGTPKTRRAYDSVDPEFDDTFPTQAEIDKNIYECFNKCFDLNARWSEKKNVPKFGDGNSTREQVEEFYSFWYEFKSWREFSYLDEEDKEKGQDRDERRWIEKENKALRIKRKKEEMMRIRALVDLAYNNDKRIQKFKAEEKERKLAAKRAKMDAAQAQKAEQERVQREAQLAKERAEKAEQKRIEQIRIEKEQAKKALKKERKTLRDKLKEAKYYGNNDKETLKNMEGVEKICELYNVNELQELNKDIEKKGQNAFFAALKNCERKITAELEELNLQQQQKQQKSSNGNSAKNAGSDKEVVKKADLWNAENMQLLIKSVNLFPAGTAQRWDVIAAFINQHTTGGVTVSARDVLNKAKAMQNSDFSKSSLKTQANDTAFENFNKSKKDVQTCNDITVVNEQQQQQQQKQQKSVTNSTEQSSKQTTNGGGDVNKSNKTPTTTTTTTPLTNGYKEACEDDKTSTATANAAAAAGCSAAPATAKAPKTWTKEEQALLEQAIKTYPISTPDRWDRIAECIPNRSKKDCLRRVKELVELVNSKKEAQQAVK